MNQSEFLAITCNSLEAREKSHVHGTASGNVTSMRKPLDGSLWFYWIVGQEANQNGGCFENYHHLRYLFSLCGVQKGQIKSLPILYI